MSKLPLTFACGLYDRMSALYTGEVQVEGVDLNFLVDDNPRNIFDRMAASLEFDVAEFSSSEYISRFVAGACPLVAIPVFYTIADDFTVAIARGRERIARRFSKRQEANG